MQLLPAMSAALAACTLLLACSADQQLPIADGPADQQFRIEPRPAGLTARTAPEAENVAALASRIAAGPAAAPASQPVAARLLPLIQASTVGRAYLELDQSRALAIGDPAAQCPALTARSGASPALAVRSALQACLSDLELHQAGSACGCRLLAVNRVALAPRAAFSYAPGLATRVLRNGRLVPLIHIAEERTDGAEGVETLILVGSRPGWRIRMLDERRAEVTALGPDGTPNGPPVVATRQLLGLDRGRFIERIEAAELTFLIGF